MVLTKEKNSVDFYYKIGPIKYSVYMSDKYLNYNVGLFHEIIPFENIKKIATSYDNDVFQNNFINNIDNIKGIGQLFVVYECPKTGKNKLSSIKLNFDSHNCHNLLEYVSQNFEEQYLGIGTEKETASKINLTIHKHKGSFLFMLLSMIILLLFLFSH